MAKKNPQPPLGIVYVLKQDGYFYWLAVDFETYERSGTYRETRTLRNLFEDEVQTYLGHGLILHEQLNKRAPK